MYEILTVINTKITVLLVVILHSLVDWYSYTSVLTLKMEVARFFKIEIPLHQTTRSQISEQMCYFIVLFGYIQVKWGGTAEERPMADYCMRNYLEL